MAESITDDWSNFTVIEQSEIEKYLFQAGQFSDGKLEVETYCIRSDGDTLDVKSYLDFLKNKLLYFVLPAEEVENSVTPYYDMRIKADPKEDFITDGLYGELILFTMVDGLLDIPMVTHKISTQQGGGEVKGADGFFFGDHKGDDSLGLAEAKFHSERVGQAIKESLDSTMRFHGSDGDGFRDDELMVARRSLTRDLSEAKANELLSLLDADRRQHKIIHPIFVGYEEQALHEVQTDPSVEDIQEEIIESIDDRNIVSKIKYQLENNYEELNKYWLLFFILPVEDSDDFKERMKNVLFPMDSQ